MADIVVNISRATAAVTRAGFGKPLIIATNANHAYKEYGTLSEVEADYAVSTVTYKMCTALKSQEFAVPKIAILGKAFTEKTAVSITENLTTADNLTYSFANDYIEVGSLAGLKDDGVAIPTENIESIDYKNGTITFNEVMGVVSVDSYSYFNDASALITELNNLINAKKDFYFVLLDMTSYRAQEQIMTWIGTQNKMFHGRTTIAYDEFPFTFTNDRIIMWYHETANEFLDAAVVGQCGPKNPGSITWKNQRLNGITPNDLDTATLSGLREERINTAIDYLGNIVTASGLAGKELYIDQVRSTDFVKIRMQENLAALLIAQDKIPYDDTGIAQIVSVITKTLNQAGNQGIIARDIGGNLLFTVTSTPRAEIPQEDIAARVLKSVTFKYIEAGAVEGVEITGQIVAEL
ncbi:DUF3383 family protein [Anaerosolibacter sp.]|uniref:DUF3383 family protein n=1 Tax=Anaerosolibacter sp. TaxID=1872527 RepID=UPI0039F0B0B8